MIPLRRRTALEACLTTVITAAVIGCGSSTVSTAPTPPSGNSYSGPAISGRAMAGNQPLIGATIQLYAAGLSGNGSAPTGLLTPALTTDSSGAFSVGAGYACPGSSSELYVLARGGKSATGASSANTAIAFLAALGQCSKAPPTVTVNEATTAAGAYALSQFLTAGGSIGSSATNSIGLQNAFDTAAALVNIGTGMSPGATLAANGSSPAATINTLANILDACAVSLTPGPCSSLFAAATPAGGTTPANTLDAALNVVRRPSANVPALFALASASPMFTPALSTAPSDLTLYIDYTGGGMNEPSGLGIDSNGNVWVASYANTATVFSPLGKPLFPSGITGFGLSASYGLAVDAGNNAWIPNEPSSGLTGNSVSVLNSNGQSIAGATGFTSGGLNYPIAVAIDTDASAWIVDYGNSHLTHLSSSGQALSGTSGFSSSQIAFPVAAAVDSSHNVWVANQSSGTVTRVSPDASQFTSFACCNAPSNLAIDRLGNVWVSNFYSDSVSEVSAAGVVVSTGYSGGGLKNPQSIAIDGAGNLWVANYRASAISELAGASAAPIAAGTALSPAAGLGSHAAMRQSYAIAVDASGNIWISNFGSNTVTEFVGLAVPVRTPLIGPPAAP